ncbi:MAG TPA: SPOR domain-containing protein [Thermoanaerobaculia bacterium]|nr:SPOR domain-containing protein [Thermoanaerobaculia bacterium]
MSEHTLVSEDQSHYEVSLTAGQAFLAFVLLLLSLAASFAFGLLIGRGQIEDRLMAKKDAAVVNETAAVAARPERVAETAVTEADFKMPEPAARKVPAPKIIEEPHAAPVSRPASAAQAVSAPTAVPHIAQLFSSSDQKSAEAMAARLIEGGFSAAYVERGTNDKGQVFRVRVLFPSEQAAREAEPRLRRFAQEVWITRQ